MPGKTRFFSMPLTIIALTLFAAVQSATAQTEKVLSSFEGTISGIAYPNGGLIADSTGNLYGTSAASGDSCTSQGCGTVFKLVPQSGGRYERIVIHTFSAAGTGAWNPQAGLAMDSAGNLYGTTRQGGPENAGTAFKLAPTTGPWKFTVLHSFGASNSDGEAPTAAVTLDALGNVYGTTLTGGTHRDGVVYELSPKTGGGYTYSIIHNFKGTDGAGPSGPMVFDSAGNLYGSAGGGANGVGVIYELTPVLGAGWTESVIYSFSPSVGTSPGPYLVFDASGNLYGAAGGGTGEGGLAFELSPESGGTRSFQVIFEFCTATACPYGTAPAGFVFDNAGNLYGVGGVGKYDEGTAVELSPELGDTWSATLLHSFGNGKDGAQPIGRLLYLGGNLYGATSYGGQYGFGTVFQIAP